MNGEKSNYPEAGILCYGGGGSPANFGAMMAAAVPNADPLPEIASMIRRLDLLIAHACEISDRAETLADRMIGATMNGSGGGGKPQEQHPGGQIGEAWERIERLGLHMVDISASLRRLEKL